MPVHSINTFLVFTLIFVWSPETRGDKNMLRNVITFLAMILTPSAIQRDHCHPPQLKKPLSTAPTLTVLTATAALLCYFLIKKREKTDQAHCRDYALCWRTHRSTGISVPSERAGQWPSPGGKVLLHFPSILSSLALGTRLHWMCDKAAVARTVWNSF